MNSSDPLLSVTRDDLLAAVEGYRLKERSTKSWISVAAGTASMLLAAILLWNWEQLGWPDWIAVMLTLASLAFYPLFLRYELRRLNRAKQALQLTCPRCGSELLSGRSSGAIALDVTRILDTGCCGRCGEALFPPSDARRSVLAGE